MNQRRISASTVVHHGDEITIGIETLTLVDQLVLSRPAHLSTLPPGSGQFSVSDVDGPVPETRAATLEILTERERQVLSLVVRGHTQREIGQQLHVSAKTVETHRSRIADKLGCRTRAELVAYAITAGLLREE